MYNCNYYLVTLLPDIGQCNISFYCGVMCVEKLSLHALVGRLNEAWVATLYKIMLNILCCNRGMVPSALARHSGGRQQVLYMILFSICIFLAAHGFLIRLYYTFLCILLFYMYVFLRNINKVREFYA